MAGRPLRRLREALNNSGDAKIKRGKLIEYYSSLPLKELLQERARLNEACQELSAMADGNAVGAWEAYLECSAAYVIVDDIVTSRRREIK